MTDEQARLHLFVSGRVQGVFFRRAAAEEAERRGLSGWVRNLPDGAVEIIAEGQRRQLEIFLAWAHRGPRHAAVAEVRADWQRYRGEFARFEIR